MRRTRAARARRAAGGAAARRSAARSTRGSRSGGGSPAGGAGRRGRRPGERGGRGAGAAPRRMRRRRRARWAAVRCWASRSSARRGRAGRRRCGGAAAPAGCARRRASRSRRSRSRCSGVRRDSDPVVSAVAAHAAMGFAVNATRPVASDAPRASPRAGAPPHGSPRRSRVAGVAAGEQRREALVVELDGHAHALGEPLRERARLGGLRGVRARQRKRQPDDDEARLALAHDVAYAGEALARRRPQDGLDRRRERPGRVAERAAAARAAVVERKHAHRSRRLTTSRARLRSPRVPRRSRPAGPRGPCRRPAPSCRARPPAARDLRGGLDDRARLDAARDERRASRPRRGARARRRPCRARSRTASESLPLMRSARSGRSLALATPATTDGDDVRASDLRRGGGQRVGVDRARAVGDAAFAACLTLLAQRRDGLGELRRRRSSGTSRPRARSRRSHAARRRPPGR